jgi:uncharacterized damage-inducible protein DinB
MQKKIDLTQVLLSSWRTNNQVSLYLVKTSELWGKRIPGYARKTIGMLAIHIYNTRYMWIKSIEKKKIAGTLSRLDPYRAAHKEVIDGLNQSNKAVLKLLHHCLINGGQLPSKPAWLNFPNDVMHLLIYFIAHEAHHRGQITMAARQLDRPLTLNTMAGLWQWNKRLQEYKKTKLQKGN